MDIFSRFAGTNCPNKREAYAILLSGSKVRGNVLSLVGPEPIPHLSALFETIAKVDGKYARVRAVENNPQIMDIIRTRIKEAQWAQIPWADRIDIFDGNVMQVPFQEGSNYYRFLDLDLMCSAQNAFPIFYSLLNRQSSFPFSDNLRKAMIGTFSLRPGRTVSLWRKENVFNELKALFATLGAEIVGFDGKIGTWGTGKKIMTFGKASFLNEHVPNIRLAGRIAQLRMLRYADGAPMLSFYVEYK
jgi:hypothetical protein